MWDQKSNMRRDIRVSAIIPCYFVSTCCISKFWSPTQMFSVHDIYKWIGLALPTHLEGNVALYYTITCLSHTFEYQFHACLSDLNEILCTRHFHRWLKAHQLHPSTLLKVFLLLVRALCVVNNWPCMTECMLVPTKCGDPQNESEGKLLKTAVNTEQFECISVKHNENGRD